VRTHLDAERTTFRLTCFWLTREFTLAALIWFLGRACLVQFPRSFAFSLFFLSFEIVFSLLYRQPFHIIFVSVPFLISFFSLQYYDPLFEFVISCFLSSPTLVFLIYPTLYSPFSHHSTFSLPFLISFSVCHFSAKFLDWFRLLPFIYSPIFFSFVSVPFLILSSSLQYINPVQYPCFFFLPKLLSLLYST
jgi:hypothetical protein